MIYALFCFVDILSIVNVLNCLYQHNISHASYFFFRDAKIGPMMSGTCEFKTCSAPLTCDLSLIQSKIVRERLGLLMEQYLIIITSYECDIIIPLLKWL